VQIVSTFGTNNWRQSLGRNPTRFTGQIAMSWYDRKVGWTTKATKELIDSATKHAQKDPIFKFKVVYNADSDLVILVTHQSTKEERAARQAQIDALL
jgi:predicted SnoaL-like aldol condensation-catalyzing enzyme